MNKLTGMNSIYKTSWGAYIDLSKLNVIQIFRYAELSDLYVLKLYFALTEMPIEIESNKEITTKRCDEIIEQWRKYKNAIK